MFPYTHTCKDYTPTSRTKEFNRLLCMCAYFLWQDVGNTSRPAFIVENDMIDEDEEFESDEEEDLFDSVCSICDNGGELLWYAYFYQL